MIAPGVCLTCVTIASYALPLGRYDLHPIAHFTMYVSEVQAS